MGKRRKARETALQFLYELDLNGEADPAPREKEFWARHPLGDGARAGGEVGNRGKEAAEAALAMAALRGTL